MIRLEGLELTRLPVELTRVRDLITYDGPLLTEFASSASEPYLYHWCDFDELVHRWLVFRTTKSKLVGYLAGQLALRDLLVDKLDGFVFAVDTDENGNATHVVMVYKAALPEAYVPTDKSASLDICAPSGSKHI